MYTKLKGSDDDAESREGSNGEGGGMGGCIM